jgi:hypothetical protein
MICTICRNSVPPIAMATFATRASGGNLDQSICGSGGGEPFAHDDVDGRFFGNLGVGRRLLPDDIACRDGFAVSVNSLPQPQLSRF